MTHVLTAVKFFILGAAFWLGVLRSTRTRSRSLWRYWRLGVTDVYTACDPGPVAVACGAHWMMTRVRVPYLRALVMGWWR